MGMSEQTAAISLYVTSCLSFIRDKHCVYSAVRTVSSIITQDKFSHQYVKHSISSINGSRRNDILSKWIFIV